MDQMQNSSTASGGSSGSGTGAAVAAPACASCRHQRKKCKEDCILAPFFPVEKTQEFQAVHRVFGVSNVSKLIKDMSREDGKRAAESLSWEAFCRIKDPVHGSYGEFKRVYDELERYKTCYSQLISRLGVTGGGIDVVYSNNNGGLVGQQGFLGWNNGINGNMVNSNGIITTTKEMINNNNNNPSNKNINHNNIVLGNYTQSDGSMDDSRVYKYCSSTLHPQNPMIERSERLKPERQLNGTVIMRPQIHRPVNDFSHQFYEQIN